VAAAAVAVAVVVIVAAVADTATTIRQFYPSAQYPSRLIDSRGLANGQSLFFFISTIASF
jgi:hypothetical protein